jgi:hypothetical protein
MKIIITRYKFDLFVMGHLNRPGSGQSEIFLPTRGTEKTLIAKLTATKASTALQTPPLTSTSDKNSMSSTLKIKNQC